jgi:hypothetical protein
MHRILSAPHARRRELSAHEQPTSRFFCRGDELQPAEGASASALLLVYAAGDEKIQVIRVVRAATGLGLEAGAPSISGALPSSAPEWSATLDSQTNRRG